MPTLDRRSAILGAAAVATAVTSPGSLAASTLSVDFRDWHALALSTDSIAAEEDAWENDNPYTDLKLSPLGRLWGSMHELEHRICERSRNADVSELVGIIAELGMIALYWSEGATFRDPFALGRDDDLGSKYPRAHSAAHLVEAAARLAMAGGASVQS